MSRRPCSREKQDGSGHRPFPKPALGQISRGTRTSSPGVQTGTLSPFARPSTCRRPAAVRPGSRPPQVPAGCGRAGNAPSWEDSPARSPNRRPWARGAQHERAELPPFAPQQRGACPHRPTALAEATRRVAEEAPHTSPWAPDPRGGVVAPLLSRKRPSWPRAKRTGSRLHCTAMRRHQPCLRRVQTSSPPTVAAT